MILLDLSGKCWQGIISFLRIRSQFSFFFEKNINLHMLDLEHPRQITNFNIITDGSYSTSENLSTV